MQEITAARKIADLILDELVPGRLDGDNFTDPAMEDRRDVAPNPYTYQTETGLGLELYYGMPSRIHTPVGVWRIGGSGSGDFTRVISTLTERLGLEVIAPLERTSNGLYGPFYAITRLDGEPLPPLKYRTNRISPEESKRIWNS